MRIVPIVACLLPLVGLCRGREEARPNLVYILADDMGYGDAGCYNPQSKIATPNLDKLASEGLRLTNEHAASSLCSPSRYGILTGRYAWRSPLQHAVVIGYGGSIIKRGRMTVASLLGEHGYATACIGKWHLGMKWPTTDGRRVWFTKNAPSDQNLTNLDFAKPILEGPTDRGGFDYYFGMDIPVYPPYCFIENDRTVGIPSVRARAVPANIVGGRQGPMTPGFDFYEIMPELTRRAVSYIDHAATAPVRRPFFLYFALTAPHTPVIPTREFQGKSGAGDYGDFVEQVDWTVGRVVEALERTGQAENTLLIFTSDNGPEHTNEWMGAYDRAWRYHHYSMGELRGIKEDTWEGGHRVPFIARWPGKIKPGSVSDETVCHTDLMATVAAILGAKLPDNAGEDSYNVLPVLLGEPHPRPIRPATVLNSGFNQFALRQGDWIFIDFYTGDTTAWFTGKGDPSKSKLGEPEWFKKERGYVSDSFPGELYNLAEDPSERHNFYGERPEKVGELKTLLEKYKAEGRSTPGRPQKNDVAIIPPSPDVLIVPTDDP